MDKNIEAASNVVRSLFKDYCAAGGVVRDGARRFSPDELASPTGLLPAIVWWLKEFTDHYKLEIASPKFVSDPAAEIGIGVTAFEGGSAAQLLFHLSDFLVNEVFSTTRDLNLTMLIKNFIDWANTAVPNYPAVPMARVQPV